jgi:hypothetical protein
MAEGDCLVTNNLKEQLMLKYIDFVNDAFKMALYDVPIVATGNPIYTVLNEIVAANYVAGGAGPLGGNLVVQDDVNNRASFDLNDASWAALGAHLIVQARLYDNTTASKWVLAVWEIATNSNGGTYTLQFNLLGVLLVT